MSTWSVTFKGFKTQQQAEEFAAWYEGQGESESGVWLEEHTDLTYANVANTVVVEEAKNVDVELKLYYKE